MRRCCTIVVVEVVRNVTAVVEESAPRRRIRKGLRESELRKLAAAESSKLDQLLAIAAFKAEEIRAEAQAVLIDEEAARARFEQNPFRWEAQGWSSRLEVGFLWTWQSSDGVGRKGFVFSRLHNVHARGVPRASAAQVSTL